jgi:large repetitive protein
VTLPAESTSIDYNVPTLEDAIDETDESLSLLIDEASNATIASNEGLGRILDDDAEPSVAIGDVKRAEGRGGRTTRFLFPVTLTGATEQTVSVAYSTADGVGRTGAREPKDYSAAAGTLTFAPGETTKTIEILVNGDGKKEATERFFVNLGSPSIGSVTDAQAIGTIRNDDR